jgi:hypothetical protein
LQPVTVQEKIKSSYVVGISSHSGLSSDTTSELWGLSIAAFEGVTSLMSQAFHCWEMRFQSLETLETLDVSSVFFNVLQVCGMSPSNST